MNSIKELSDKEIIEAILDGNPHLYREIVSRYKDRVYAVALKISHHPKDAEDITQDVFLQVYHSLANYHFDSSLSTWIYKISVNKGLDWKRKNKMKKKESLYEEDQIYSISDDTEPTLLKKERNMKLQQILQTIPEIYQSVLLLYYYEHLTYLEIAQRLDITSKTVESRLYRAKKMMKKKLLKEGIL